MTETEKQSVSESNASSREAIKKLAPDFHQMSLDIQEVMQHSKDPAFTAALMFKLVQEREQTNKLLEKINDKYDEIMFELKTRQTTPTPAGQNPTNNPHKFEVLPEQDQMILHLAEQKGHIDAIAVQQSMGYKGVNAACQRLNKLFKEGHLKKIQSGKKVLYATAFT